MSAVIPTCMLNSHSSLDKDGLWLPVVIKNILYGHLLIFLSNKLIITLISRLANTTCLINYNLTCFISNLALAKSICYSILRVFLSYSIIMIEIVTGLLHHVYTCVYLLYMYGYWVCLIPELQSFRAKNLKVL